MATDVVTTHEPNTTNHHHHHHHNNTSDSTHHGMMAPTSTDPHAPICTKKYTIADYAHRRARLQLKKPASTSADRHREHQFHGVKSSNVTQHLAFVTPSHSYHPSLRDAPPPAFHRKSTSITEDVLGPVHVKRFDPTLPPALFNRMATDVTEQLRFVPPAHALSNDSNDVKPDPWYGRTRTFVTNPDVDDYSLAQVNKGKCCG